MPLFDAEMKKHSHLADNNHMAGNTWRKREGIEPSEDISASRPDLKSGRATSAPSASVEDGSPARPGGKDYFCLGASFARFFFDFSFRCLRRRISRFLSVVMRTPPRFAGLARISCIPAAGTL